jgi:hypothetical protein
LNLRSEPGHRRGESRAEVSALSARDQVALPGSMKKDFDALHGSILLKANNGVNRPRQTNSCTPDGGLGSFAHTIRNIRVMGVKNYLHF